MGVNQENRSSRRVEFFNVPMGDSEIRPVWVFSSGRSETAICGLVINMSKSGVQILTEAHHPMISSHYKITFILDDEAAGLGLADCYLERIWTEHQSSLHACSGFRFVGQLPASVFVLLESDTHHVRKFLRCEIDAVDPDGLDI